MKLSDFVIPELKNKYFNVSGIDSIEHCSDKNFFQSFPYQVTYKYNSKGFRDREWPDSIENCVWCIGDSFTVGLGLPFELIWTQQLQLHLNVPVITIAIDGASNQWIARKVKQVQNTASPVCIIAMWSYFHRRENNDSTLTDLQRRQHATVSTEVEDFELFENLIRSLASDHLVNLIVPDFHDVCALQKIWQDVRDDTWAQNTPASLDFLPNEIKQELHQVHKVYDKLEVLIDLNHRFNAIKSLYRFVEYDVVDLARDSHHFGPKTCESIAAKLLPIVAGWLPQ